MGRSYSHLSREQRQVIADSLAIGKLAKDIAVTLSLHISTVYREIERGKNPDTNKYEPEFSENKYQSNLADKGKSPRLEENKEMASVISELILKEGLSPEQAILRLKEDGYTEVPTKTTIYTAIDRGLIPNVTRESLYTRNATVFSDGMIHLPKWVREKLSINDGDNLLIEVDDDKCVAQKAYHTRTIKESNTLNLEQIVILINASRGTGIYMQVLFAVLMGLRRGEINGLKYGDIDFIRQKLHVSRQLGRAANSDDIVFAPKTRTKQEIKLKTLSSDRVLDIPDFVFEEILKSREQYERNRSRRSKTFQDLDYICCSNYGRPRSMQYHFKPFKEILQKSGLPDIRWHDLRHSYATLLMKNDFNLKAISKILGHAKEIVTADIYVDNQEIIADGVGELKEYMDEVVPQRPTDFNEKERVFDYSDFDVTAAFDGLTV